MPEQAPPSPEPTGLPAVTDERRESQRFPPEPSSVCRLVGETQEDINRATARDTPPRGIGVLVQRPIKAGTVLILSLEVRECRLPRPLPVRVMHASPAA